MSKLTQEIYQKYVRSLGPEQIASPKALRIIEHFMEKFIEEIGISARNNLKFNPSTKLLQHSKGSVGGGQSLKLVQELAPYQI